MDKAKFMNLINKHKNDLAVVYRQITRDFIIPKIYEDHSLIGQPAFKLKNIMLASSTFHTLAHPYINFTLKIRKFGSPARSLDLFEKGPNPPKGICLGIEAFGPTLIQNVQYGPAPWTLGGLKVACERKQTSLLPNRWDIM